MEQKVLTAARKFFHQKTGVSAVYEHGQWWVIREGAEGTENYSVNDAEGIGTVNGFSFEQV